MTGKLAAAVLAMMLIGAPALLPAQEQKEMTREEMMAQAEARQPKVGDVFPDFTGETYDGEEVSLSDYRGKVTLVDFWATWCGPCLAELPYLKTAYKDLHSKGFDVIGVSLDRKREDLQKFYENESTTLGWKSISDFEYWNSAYADRFGIRSIPATFLLDEEGKVIGRDLRGNDLYRAVAARVAPDMKPPKDMNDLLVEFQSDKAAREALQPRIIEMAKENSNLANGFVWSALDGEAELDAQTKGLMYEMMKASVGEDGGYSELDTYALAAYSAGHADEAVSLQQKAIDSGVARLKRADLPEDKIATHPMILEFKTRQALYKAESGDLIGAGELLTAVRDGGGDAAAADKYFKKASELVAKGMQKS